MYIRVEIYDQVLKERNKLKRALTDISEIDYLNVPNSELLIRLQDAVLMAGAMLDDLYNK